MKIYLDKINWKKKNNLSVLFDFKLKLIYILIYLNYKKIYYIEK